MGIKDSKRIKILREKGISTFMRYLLGKNYARWQRCMNKICVVPLLTLYPKLTLHKNQYKTFKAAKKYFKENYINIITINPLFFIQNLKKHITWIETKEFQQKYGNIFIHYMQTNTESSPKDSTHTTHSTKNNAIIPPPLVSLIPHDSSATQKSTHDSTRILKEQIRTKQKIQTQQNPSKYPPLLNPKEINYKQIESSLAWELNLPLPENYRFVWVSNGGSGSEAMMVFFAHCGVHLEPFWFHEREKYMLDYNLLLARPNDYNILCIYVRFIGEKYLSLLQKRDFLYVAGDVISRFKVGLNHLSDVAISPNMKDFSLHTPLDSLFPKLVYCYPDTNGLPNVTRLNNHILESYTGFYDFACRAKPYINNLYCISTNDLSKNNAFITFHTLSTLFAFPKKPQDIKIFQQRANMFRGGLYALPVNLHIALPDTSNIAIRIMPYRFSPAYKNTHIDTTESLLSYTPIIDSMEIVCMMEERDYHRLAQHESLLKETKSYLVGYMEALEKSVEETKTYLVSEHDILGYLQTQSQLRTRLQELLHDEMEYFRIYCPHVVDLWKYCIEFESFSKEAHATKS